MPKLEEFIVPRVFALLTDQDGEGSVVEEKLLGRQNLGQNLVLFAGKKKWRREIVAKFASGATMLIDLWSEETIYLALESSKTQRKRERHIARLR